MGGQLHWNDLPVEEQQAVKDTLAEGRNEHNDRKKTEAEVKYNTPGPPLLVPNRNVWKCKGFSENQNPCKFECVKGMNLGSFFHTTDLEGLHRLANHRLLDLNCNMSSCGGECRPVAQAQGKTYVGLKCNLCGEVSKGGTRGFWRGGRLGLGVCDMIFILFFLHYEIFITTAL